MAEAKSFRDPSYDSLDEASAAKVGIDPALLRSIRLNGERTNSDKVSSAGARTSWQITPQTRKLIENKYGIDPWLNDKNASLGAAYLLKESLDRNKGDAASAVREYHGGTNPENHGPITRAYVNRVMTGMPALQPKQDVGADFDRWMASRPSPERQAAETAVATATGSGNAQAQPASVAPKDIGAEFDAWQAKQPGLGAELTRGLGLGTRNLIEGIGSGIGVVYNPIAATINAATGSQIPTAETQASRVATGLGLPQALTPTEQLLGQVQNMAASNIPTIGFGSAIQASKAVPATAQQVGRVLAEKPVEQVVSSAVAGGAGEAARQAGFDTAGQVASSLAGGVAGLGGARAIEAAAPAVTRGAQIAGDAAQQAGQAVKGAAQRVTGTVDDAAGAGARSVGAAEVPEAAVRRASAADLPVPVDLTKGQATRDFGQQQFEREAAKNAEIGGQIRERFAQQNEQVQQNLDAFIDASGAQATDLRSAGVTVDKAVRDAAAKAKAEIRVAYKNAEKAGETLQPVATNPVVDTLNASTSAESLAPIIGGVRKEIIRLGGAVDDAGNLVAKDMTLGDMETLRKFVNKNAGVDPTNIKYAADIKRAIDSATDGVGGELYNRARRLRSKFAKEYENRAVIADLLGRKRGSDDRKVAFEDVVDRVVNRGSLDDVRFARKILQTSGDEGKQAWREIQGATLADIKDQATRNVARDERGNAIISPAGLDKAIKRLEADGKLDFIFGKRGAEQLRTINDVSKTLFTAPPGSVNTSNTSSAIINAIDLALSASTGLPAPIATLWRQASKHIKDRKLKARIQQALAKPKQQTERF